MCGSVGQHMCCPKRVAHAPPVPTAHVLSGTAGTERNKLRADMSGRQVHRAGTFVLSLLMMAIGVALIGQVISEGGSPVSGRALLGVLFLAAGVGRTYIELKRGDRA
jgi:hypothetical protein